MKFFLVTLLFLGFCKPDHSRAEKIYKSNCIACHGEKGYGDGAGANAFNPGPRNFHLPTERWVNGKTREGIIKTLSEGVMPNMWAYDGPKEDIPLLADYILFLGKE